MAHIMALLRSSPDKDDLDSHRLRGIRPNAIGCHGRQAELAGERKASAVAVAQAERLNDQRHGAGFERQRLGEVVDFEAERGDRR
jgi:hypothetical protein